MSDGGRILQIENLRVTFTAGAKPVHGVGYVELTGYSNSAAPALANGLHGTTALEHRGRSRQPEAEARGLGP